MIRAPWFVYTVCLVALLAPAPALSQERLKYYVVDHFDYLISILRRAGLKPVYGQVGSLKDVEDLNADHISDVDLIRPGEKIFLPDRLVAIALKKGRIKILNRQQIVFTRPQPASTTDQKAASAEDAIDAAADADAANAHVEAPNAFADSVFRLALESGYSRIDSVQANGSAILLSKPAIGASLQWQQNWSEKWQSYIHWNLTSASFENATQGTISGSQRQSTSLFSFGVQRSFDEKTIASIELGAKEKIYSMSYTAGSATLETAPIGFIALAASKAIARVRQLELLSLASADYLTGTSGSRYDVQPGYEFSLGLQVSHRLSNVTLFAMSKYGETHQNTSLTLQSQKEIRSQIGIEIPIGKESKK